MTKEVAEKLPRLYSQEDKYPNTIFYVKYFDPFSNWTWYCAEYDPKSRTFFGYVEGFENEWGFFSLEELEGVGHIE
jgi:hypothetical protein